MSETGSKQALLNYLKEVEAHFANTGQQLTEGARRVLSKLEESEGDQAELRRTYIERDGMMMWDLISTQQLKEQGYSDTGSTPRSVVGDGTSAKRDVVRYWRRESDGKAMWVGEPLT